MGPTDDIITAEPLVGGGDDGGAYRQPPGDAFGAAVGERYDNDNHRR